MTIDLWLERNRWDEHQHRFPRPSFDQLCKQIARLQLPIPSQKSRDDSVPDIQRLKADSLRNQPPVPGTRLVSSSCWVPFNDPGDNQSKISTLLFTT